MKPLLPCSLLALFCWTAEPATYYVRTDGHDTASGANDTADETTGAWLTVTKAIGTVASGDVVYIGDGTYAANLVPTVDFTSETLFTSTTGNRTNVILTGTTGVPLTQRANFATWSNLTFSAQQASLVNVVQVREGLNVKFAGCIFQCTNDTQILQIAPGAANEVISNTVVSDCILYQTDTATTPHGIVMSCVAGRTNNGVYVTNTTVSCYGRAVLLNAAELQNIVFSGCTLASTNNYAMFYSEAATRPTNLTIISCTLTGKTDTVYLACGKNVLVDGCSIYSGGSHGVMFGTDDVYDPTYAGAFEGTIRNSIVTVANGGAADHAILLGANCINSVAYKNSVTSDNWGIVIKENVGCSAVKNTVRSAANVGIYAKGTTNALIAQNLVYVPDVAKAFGLESGHGEGTAHASLTVLTNNWVVCPSVLVNGMYWKTDDDENGVSDGNAYFFCSTPNFGSVFGTTNIFTVEAMRAAWATYDVSSNDVHSWYGPTLNPGFAQ